MILINFKAFEKKICSSSKVFYLQNCIHYYTLCYYHSQLFSSNQTTICRATPSPNQKKNTYTNHTIHEPLCHFFVRASEFQSTVDLTTPLPLTVALPSFKQSIHIKGASTYPSSGVLSISAEYFHEISFDTIYAHFLKEMMLSNVSSRYSFLPNSRGGEDGEERCFQVILL